MWNQNVEETHVKIEYIIWHKLVFILQDMHLSLNIIKAAFISNQILHYRKPHFNNQTNLSKKLLYHECFTTKTTLSVCLFNFIFKNFRHSENFVVKEKVYLNERDL